MFRPCRIFFFFLSRAWHWWLQSWRLSMILKAKCSSWVSIDDWLYDEILLTKKCCPMNWCRRGWENAISTSVTDVGSSKECLQRKCFSSFVKTCRFSSFDRWKAEKAAMMKWEKNDRSDAMFRRIDPVPSFFSFSVTSFTSSWLHRRLMVFKFSNFCIVFFIFQRVQSFKRLQESWMASCRRLLVED